MGSLDFSDLEPTSPPPRGFRPQLVATVRQANAWLEEHGSIGGGRPIESRSTARYHAQRMKRLLVQMGHRQPWELRERVWQEDGESGFRWSVMFERGDDQA